MNSFTNTETESRGNLRDFLNIIFKHKSKIIIIFLTVVLTVTIGTFLISPTYEAFSQILVKFGRENIYTPTATGSQVLFDISKEDRINSEVEIIKGRNLIEKVITELGVKNIYPDLKEKPFISNTFSKKIPLLEKAVLIFQQKLTVEGVTKSDIIEIKFQHKDRVVAAQVVNRLIDVYLEHHITVFKQSQNYNFFDDQVKLLEKKLKDSEEELEAFKYQNNISSLTEQKTVLLQQISEMELELAKTRSEISEKIGKIQALNKYLSEPSAKIELGQETDFNPYSVSNIRNRVAELKLREGELLSKYNEQSQLVTNVRQEIEKANQLLDKEERTYHDKAVKSINDDLNALRSKGESQKQHLSQYQQELNRIKSVEMRLNELERQAKLNEDSYQLYVQKTEESRISNAMDNQKIANISVVQPALPPIKPVKPKTMLNIILSIILGGFAGVGTAFFIEYLSHTFSTREDVEKHLGLPVVGSIPDK
ncbi:MAG: GumC family protein [Proteobacteria bacterium]|nr:GumC family protein [Pseudomonadota bacterium]